MTSKTFLTAILGLSLMIGSMPLSFAEPPSIEENCELQQNKQSNDCILLQKINELEAELKAKDAELEADVDTTCASIPVVKTGFGLVTSSTVAAFATTNLGIGTINTWVVGPLNAFDLNIINVDPPNLPLGNILPNGIDVGTFQLDLGVLGTYTMVDPFDINLEFTALNIDLPPINVPSFQPFAGIPNIPEVDTTEVEAADNAVQSLNECA